MIFPEITRNFMLYAIPDSKACEIYLIFPLNIRKFMRYVAKFPEPGQVTFI